MKKSLPIAALCIVLFVVAGTTLAERPKEGGNCGPLIDATPETSALYAASKVEVISPEIVQRPNANTKISSVKVKVTTPDGESFFGDVSCKLTCNGSSCVMAGCSGSDGCSWFQCQSNDPKGGSCSGSCVRTSGGGGPSPELPGNN
ncbi:MAG: hypothetical protein AAF604_14985 [Acidobacteriota bacterium]